MKRLCFSLAMGLVFLGTISGVGAASVARKPYIVVLKGSVTRPDLVAAAHGKSHGFDVTFTYNHALKGYAATVPVPAVSALSADPRVAFISPDNLVAASAQFLGRGVNRIDGEQSSTLSGDGTGSENVNVAVLDSGIDSSHPDLNVVGGTNCTNDKGGFDDTQGHGSLVGGSIGALDNDTGFVGVAPGARLWSVRVFRENLKSPNSRIICGIDWVTSTRTDADPNNDIAVANLSLGGKGEDDGNCGMTNRDATHLAICRSVAAGVTYVVSAGNESTDLRRVSPAAYDEVLTATAMGDTDGQPGGLGGMDVCGDGQSDDVAASFSNFATTTDDLAHTISGPGVCVESTFIDGGYGHGSGTSFSSPLVAGTVALCISSGACSGMTPPQIIQKMVADAEAYNNAKLDYGFDGDPNHPIAGRYYGYLVRAALY